METLIYVSVKLAIATFNLKFGPEIKACNDIAIAVHLSITLVSLTALGHPTTSQ